MYPRIVKIRQIQNSIPMAYLKKTPKGGNKIASKISINVAAAIVAELPTKPN